MNHTLNFIRTLLTLDLFKTLYINFKYFQFKEAMKLPIYIYPHTIIEKAEGKICILDNITPGMVKFGKHGKGNRLHSIWLVSGTIILHGGCYFGSGIKLSVGDNATINIGKRVSVTGDTSIICKNNITIGDDCIISWDVLVMDTDFHNIKDKEERIINHSVPIRIGEKVWISCRCSILKGAFIRNGCIVACGSTVTKGNMFENSIISENGGHVKTIRQSVTWEK